MFVFYNAPCALSKRQLLFTYANGRIHCLYPPFLPHYRILALRVFPLASRVSASSSSAWVGCRGEGGGGYRRKTRDFLSRSSSSSSVVVVVVIARSQTRLVGSMTAAASSCASSSKRRRRRRGSLSISMYKQGQERRALLTLPQTPSYVADEVKKKKKKEKRREKKVTYTRPSIMILNATIAHRRMWLVTCFFLLACLSTSICVGEAAFCPNGCNCDDNTLVASCISAKLDVIPIALNPSIQRVVLRDNQIRTVDAAAFQFYGDLKNVDLSYNQLVAVPERTFEAQKLLMELHLKRNRISTLTEKTFLGLRSLAVLNLRNNFLETLANGLFASLDKLEELDLGQNRISVVEPGAFHKLGSLRVLYLDDNQLKEIPSAALKPLNALAELHIGLNAFTSLPDEAFKGLEKLVVLDITAAGLDNISADAFRGLEALKTLQLNGNKLREIPTKQLSILARLEVLALGQNDFATIRTGAFKGLTNLKRLEISGSKLLTTVKRGAFADNGNLEYLTLNNNKRLTTLEDGALEGLPNLRELMLRDNSFATFSESLVAWSELRRLDLSENPLVCDCGMLWLSEVLAPRNSSPVICSEPKDLQGKSLRGMRPEDLGCAFSDPRKQALLLTLCAASVAFTAGVAFILYYRCKRRVSDAFKDYEWKNRAISRKEHEYQKTFSEDEYIVRAAHPHHQPPPHHPLHLHHHQQLSAMHQQQLQQQQQISAELRAASPVNHHQQAGGVWFLPHGGTQPAEGFTYIDGETAHKMRHLGHTGTLPGGGSSALRLCSSPTCTNNIVASSELANGTVGNNSQASTMQHHTYSSIGAPTYHSLRRSARSSRSARGGAAPTSSSPSPPPPPPPRYPGQYPTLPANGSVCHHYNSSRYNNGSAEGCREQQQQQSAGTIGAGRESRSKSSSRRMEQLSASSHQQRQEELQVHRGGYHAKLERRDDISSRSKVANANFNYFCFFLSREKLASRVVCVSVQNEMAITDDDLSDSDDSVISINAPVASLTGQQRLERLRSLRERYNWGIQMERRVFFGKFKTLIVGWTDHYPDLRDFFARDEIDWMLADFVADYDIETLPFIEFVYVTGYRDAPDVDEAGEPTRLRRTTPVHRSLDQELDLRKDIALKLFKIYDSYDANYEDELGVTHFHVACETGCADVVEKFLDLGQDPDLPERKTGKTPLQLALLTKQQDVVEVLLDYRADPNLTDKSGLTALHLACKMIPVDSVKVVAIIDTIFEICTERRRSVSVDALDKTERTALHLALLVGQKPIVEALLRWGADPNRRCAKGMTYLHVICRKPGDDDLAELFLEINKEIGREVLIDARDKLGWTPLHYALYYGKRRTIETLLRWGADPNSRIVDGGFTPVHLLAHRKIDDDLAKTFFRIIKVIGERVEIDALDTHGWTALLAALNLGHAKAFETLLRNGADPNLTKKDGSTALHVICKRKNDDDDLLKKLFEICVDAHKPLPVDARDKHGWTPLHLALRDGKRRIAEELLRRGADPNLTRENGSTALHTVCKRLEDDAGDLAKMIFELCSDAHKPLLVDARDKHGWTPLNLALYYRKAKVVEALLRGGADPNLIHFKGLTPLHIVCQGKTDDDLPEIFLRSVDDVGKTVRIDALDDAGKTPLQHTLCNDKLRHIETLLRRGADPNVADARGYAPLHTIVIRKEKDDLLEKFLEICSELRKTVEVDVADKRGWTPLLLALYRGHKRVIETLLRNGAEPKLDDEEWIHGSAHDCQETGRLRRRLGGKVFRDLRRSAEGAANRRCSGRARLDAAEFGSVLRQRRAGLVAAAAWRRFEFGQRERMDASAHHSWPKKSTMTWPRRSSG
ncbi:unnamed protein product [Trichogramma brassicae]|uniref:LRRCT domain-containing protein n=1 Tax=Trichogramma brassicae TaxID=86971 RepID=A0A6H5I088_9HYME|nr:unnamed protein product [Trichogramma brassicae]